MKIALVSEHASPLAALGGADAGGQNVHVAALAGQLARRGHKVTVYTRRDDVALPARVPLRCGVTVAHVDAGPARAVPKDGLLQWMPDFGRVLHEEWRQRPPDVVHSHFWMSGLASLAAAEPLGIPVVHTYHALGVVKRRNQGAADTSPPDRIELERQIGGRSTRVIATCTDEIFELARMGVDAGRVTVVPCGVATDVFTPYGDTADRTERPRILSISRLVPRKGVGTVIEALAQVPDAELIVAGGPTADRLDGDPDVIRLRGVSRRFGVTDRVRFRGSVARDDVPGLIRSSDLVVATPWYEPFGIVPLEAMACARPVVAAAVGGLVDTVVEDVTGVFVPPRDADAVAAALAALIADPVRRDRLGRAGLLRARGRYGWERIAADTEQVYREVLADRRPLTVGAAGVRR